ncbi:hypothetical protein [Streptococcus pluranimalium]
MKQHLKENQLKKKILYLLLRLLALGTILGETGVFSSHRYFSKKETKEVEIQPKKEDRSTPS